MHRVPWNLDELSKPPAVYSAENPSPIPGIRSLYFDNEPYGGKPARAFAYYGLPEGLKGEKVPAMVLIHGGCGTAFADWVKLWNDRGYAAISMDTCGSVSDNAYCKYDRAQHAWAGPRGWGGFDAINDAPADQWSYHAVAAVIRAHSLIRSFPEVDPARIGVTGVSWGGYLTCIASSIDPRFAFAAPVYGCGSLRQDSAWVGEFEKMGEERANRWTGLWDPVSYLPLSRTPTLWVNGTNDFAYPLSCYQRSYRLPPGPCTLCIRINMLHGHGGSGERPEEISRWLKTSFAAARSLTRISTQSHDAGLLQATYEGNVVRAELIFTNTSGPWPARIWQFTPANLDRANKRVASPRQWVWRATSISPTTAAWSSAPNTLNGVDESQASHGV